MKTLNKYSKFIPYFYFLAVVGYWFTVVNRTEGLTAYPILLFGIPFLWQIIKPNSKFNLILKITFVCSSLYLILAHIFEFSIMAQTSDQITDFVMYGGLLVLLIFSIQIWIVKNSLHQSL